MSFRNRLTLFFVLIVVVPMVAVAFVLFRLIADNESGKADARLAARQQGGDQPLPRGPHRRRPGGARDRAATWRSRRRCAPNDTPGAPARACDALLKQRATCARIVVARGEPGGRSTSGSATAVFPATRDLVGRRQAGRSARSQVSVQDARRPTRAWSSASTGSRRSCSGSAGPCSRRRCAGRRPRRDSRRDHGEVDGRRASATRAPRSRRPASSASAIAVAVLAPKRDGVHGRAQRRACSRAASWSASSSSRFTFALLVSRSLQRQIDAFLEAARRLGAGDFSAEVPTVGHDEFAALGEEFNKMSRQLEERLEELDQERARLQDAMRRIGETFASNLDRDGAAGDRRQDRGRRRRRRRRPRARCGRRAARRSSRSRSPATVDGLEEAVRAAEAQRARDRRAVRGAPSTASARSRTRCARGDDATARVVGRRLGRRAATGRSRAAERELFHYLAGAGRGVDRERRPARDGRAPGGHRRAHRACSTAAASRRRWRPRSSARRRFGQPVGPRAARHRRLQARQRHLRPPAGRPRAARGGAGAARDLARDRRAGALRRRGARRRAARAPTSRAPTTSPSACARGSRRCALPLLDGDGRRCGSPRASARRRCRGRPTTCAGSSRRPTRRSTGPSAPARTAPSGLRPHPV